MKTIWIGNIKLNDQHQSIAVPITAEDITTIEQQLQMIDKASVDLIELRVDFLNQLNESTLSEAKQLISNNLPQTPIIATLRTHFEGGNFDAIQHDYLSAIKTIINIGFSAVDIEINQLGAASLIELAHQQHQIVIGSYHNFNQTPTDQSLLRIWKSMQALDCDIAKVAVMPTNKEDVIRLMQTSLQANEELTIPIISMAMGPLGVVTRISGQLTGSVITFGSISNENQSAPGQLTSSQLATIFKLINS